MVKLILIIIFLLWGYSYIRFRRKMKYYTVMYNFLKEEVEDVPRPMNKLRLSGACLMLQRYKEAYEIYEQLLPIYPDREKLETNMAFCSNPLPWVNKIKNYNKSWLHDFFLVRFGKKRYSFLTQEDDVITEALMRLPDGARTNKLTVQRAVPVFVYMIVASGGSDEQSMLNTPAFQTLLNNLGVRWNECKKYIGSPKLYDLLKGAEKSIIYDAAILTLRMLLEITNNDMAALDRLGQSYYREFEKIGYSEEKIEELLKTGGLFNEDINIQQNNEPEDNVEPGDQDVPSQEYAIIILFYRIGTKGGFDENNLKNTNAFCSLLIDAGVVWDFCKPHINAHNIYDTLRNMSEMDISVYMVLARNMIDELVVQDSSKEEAVLQAFYHEFGLLGYSQERIDTMVWITKTMNGM